MIHFHLMNLIIAIPPGPPSQANNFIAKNSHKTGYMIHFHLMNLIIAIPPGPPSQAPS